MKLTLKDMEILKLEEGDVVVVSPKEGYQIDPAIFHKALAKLQKETGIRFLAGEMLNVSVLRPATVSPITKG